MATTATISLTSDISGDATNINETATLTKSGSDTTGLNQFTGVSTVYYGSTQSAVLLIPEDMSVAGSDGAMAETTVAHKVYIRNATPASVGATAYATIDIDSSANEPLGRLYSGDWMFFPWMGTKDIDLTTNTAGMTIEYAVISQDPAS